jgi:hypothetical protein
VRIKSETSQVLLSTCLFPSLCESLLAHICPRDTKSVVLHVAQSPPSPTRMPSSINLTFFFITSPLLFPSHLCYLFQLLCIRPNQFVSRIESYRIVSYRIESNRIVLYRIQSYRISPGDCDLLYSTLPLAPSVVTTDCVHHTACIPQGLAGRVSGPPPVLWQSCWGRRRGRRLSGPPPVLWQSCWGRRRGRRLS